MPGYRGQEISVGGSAQSGFRYVGGDPNRVVLPEDVSVPTYLLGLVNITTLSIESHTRDEDGSFVIR